MTSHFSLFSLGCVILVCPLIFLMAATIWLLFTLAQPPRWLELLLVSFLKETPFLKVRHTCARLWIKKTPNWPGLIHECWRIAYNIQHDSKQKIQPKRSAEVFDVLNCERSTMERWRRSEKHHHRRARVRLHQEHIVACLNTSERALPLPWLERAPNRRQWIRSPWA
jgi:hypothetical protein